LEPFCYKSDSMHKKLGEVCEKCKQNIFTKSPIPLRCPSSVWYSKEIANWAKYMPLNGVLEAEVFSSCVGQIHGNENFDERFYSFWKFKNPSIMSLYIAHQNFP
jgi:hypothetical protein